MRWVGLILVVVLVIGCEPEGVGLRTSASVSPAAVDALASVRALENQPIQEAKPWPGVHVHVQPKRSAAASATDCREYTLDCGSQVVSDFDESHIPQLIDCIERATDTHWVFTFARFWLHCHPNREGFEFCDVNHDGLTNYEDFSLLAEMEGE